MIKTDLISKSFKQKHSIVHALRNVSIHISKGEFVSIIGPSGSGKSTLLLMLGGMSTPTQGDVYYENESIYGLTQEKRALWRAKKAGFVFQAFNLIPYLTVYENVSVAIHLFGDSNDNKSKIIALLDRMRLSDRLDHLPSELSVGQQQRLALARALIKEPEILFADEPTGNLDPDTTLEMIELLKQSNKNGMTIVFITHNHEIARMADRTIKIVQGEIANR